MICDSFCKKKVIQSEQKTSQIDECVRTVLNFLVLLIAK